MKIVKRKAGERYHPLTYKVNLEVKWPHEHSTWEITFILNGNTENIINDKAYHMQKCDFTILGPMHKHYYSIDKTTEYEHRDFYIEKNDFQALCNSLSPTLYSILSDKDKPYISRIPENVMLMLENRLRLLSLAEPSDIRPEEHGILLSLGAYVLGLVLEDLLKSHHPYPKWLLDLMMKFDDYEIISENLTELVSLSNYSYEHMAREFKKYTGSRLVDYFRKIKLNYALTLIENSDYSILEIASRLGYDSTSHFINIFKKAFGSTPHVYRKNLMRLQKPKETPKTKPFN